MSEKPSEQSASHKKCDSLPASFRFDNPWLNGVVEGTLSKSGYLIVQLILSFNAAGRPCFAFDMYIAAGLGISKAGVKNELIKMHAQGWLVRRYSGKN